jgi:hypothetical protein
VVTVKWNNLGKHLSSPEVELSRIGGVDTEGSKLKGQKIGWPNDILSENFLYLTIF